MVLKQNHRKKSITLLSILLIVGTIIFFITLDHSYLHSGILAEQTDFENAFGNLLKSHEGIIVIIVIGTAGLVVGYYLKKQK
jgi:hypothetical protein